MNTREKWKEDVIHAEINYWHKKRDRKNYFNIAKNQQYDEEKNRKKTIFQIRIVIRFFDFDCSFEYKTILQNDIVTRALSDDQYNSSNTSFWMNSSFFFSK